MKTIFHARIIAMEPDIENVYLTATTFKFAEAAAIDYLTKQYNELYPEKDDRLIEHREAYIETFIIDIIELPLIDVDLLEPSRCTKEDELPSHPYWTNHIIFQVDNTDYCREEPTLTKTDEIHKWANQWCQRLDKAHPGKTFTYRFERW